MKVYLVYSGSYSDYSINEVFSTEQKAEDWIKVQNSGYASGTAYESNLYGIDEREMDAEEVAIDDYEEKTKYSVSMHMPTGSFDESKFGTEKEWARKNLRAPLGKYKNADFREYCSPSHVLDPWNEWQFQSYISKEHAEKLAIEERQLQIRKGNIKP